MSFECDTQQAQPQYDSKSPRKGLEIWTKTTRQRGDEQSHIDLWWNNRIIFCPVPCFSKWYMEGKQIAETNVFETRSGQVSVPRTELCMSDNSERSCWATWYLWKLAKTAKTWNSVMVILDWWANLDEQMLSYLCNICEAVKQQLGGQDECNSKAGNCAIARRAKWNSTLELLLDSGHCHLCNNPKLGFKSTASKFKQL